MPDLLLRLSEICKAYRHGAQRQSVLENVNLEIHRGEVVVLEGPSGVGKSTLLHLIAGLATPDQGQLWLEGRALHRFDEARWCQLRRQQIGLIFQFFNLVPTLTVEENLQLGFALNRLPTDPAAIQHYLHTLQLDGLAGYFPQQLSGGQQQRVAIARTLLQQPLLILADEPTGNLDRENAARVMTLLLEQSRNTGAALLIATHDLTIAERADRVLRLEAGQLQAVCTDAG